MALRPVPEFRLFCLALRDPQRPEAIRGQAEALPIDKVAFVDMSVIHRWMLTTIALP